MVIWKGVDRRVVGFEVKNLNQEFGRLAVATALITQTNDVKQSVDLTDKGMGNHYLRDVHDVSYGTVSERTVSLTYITEGI
jgi:hypothetical protein